MTSSDEVGGAREGGRGRPRAPPERADGHGLLFVMADSYELWVMIWSCGQASQFGPRNHNKMSVDNLLAAF
jgi:hypothetical protein